MFCFTTYVCEGHAIAKIYKATYRYAIAWKLVKERRIAWTWS